jgi:FSR family fosmidomycin resistance protein-like MFS transporter
MGDGLPWREVLQGMGPLLIPVLGVTLARSFAAVSLTTYLPILLTEQGSDLWFAGLSLSIFELAGVAGALVGGTISDGLGRKLVLTFSLVVTPVLMLIFLSARGLARFPLLLLLGFSALSVTPVVMAVMQERFPENRALATGIYMTLSFLIRSLAVVILGGIGDIVSTETSFTVSAFVVIVGLPFVLMLPGRRDEETVERVV